MSEIEVYQPSNTAIAVPDHDTDSWIAVCSDVIKVANVIYDTPFVPEGLRGSAPAVAAAILAGRELGIGPMTALQHIHVIKGKPAQSAALMRALIQGAGHQWRDGDITDTRAVVYGRRKGESEWAQASFTADQAKRAGIDLGKYPQDKLYARATSRLARRKFADVIAGMPYSAEELEDGAEGETAPEPPAASNGHAEPKPRTAQRRARSAAPPAETPAKTEDSAGQAAGPVSSGPPQPPLPGEEERDYDSPGTVTTPQLTAIWTVLSKEFGFGSDEKDQARAVCAQVIGRELATTKDMARNEAKTVLDTLANWRQTAGGNGMEPREFLIELMAAAVAQDASEDPDESP